MRLYCKKIIFCIITIVSLLLNVLHKFRLNKVLRCKLHFGKPESGEQYVLLDNQWRNYERRGEAIASGRLAQGGRLEMTNNIFLLRN